MEQEQESKQEKIGFWAKLGGGISSFWASVVAAVSAGCSLLVRAIKWVVFLPIRLAREIAFFLIALVVGLFSLLFALVKRIVVILIIVGIAWSLNANRLELRTAGELAKAEKIYREDGPHDAFAFLDKSFARSDRRVEFKLASLAAEAGSKAAAAEIYKKIIDKQQYDPVGHYHFAVFLKKQGELGEATKKLAKAIKLVLLPNEADDDKRPIFNKDYNGRLSLDYEAAFEYLKALALDISQNPPLVAKALELPSLPEVHEMRAEYAWLLFRRGYEDESIEIFRYLKNEHKFISSYSGALGSQLAYKGSDLDEAIKLLNEAIEDAPNDPNFLAALGWAQYRQNKLNDDARKNLEKALENDQGQDQYDYVRTLAHYGVVRWENEDEKEALTIWREGWCEAPEHDVLKDTLENYKINWNLRRQQSPRGAMICRTLDR